MEDRHDSMEARLLNSKREPIVDEQARFVRASATPAGGFICCFGQRSSLYRGRDVATKNAGRFPGCSWRSLPAGGTLVGSVVNAGTPHSGVHHVVQKRLLFLDDRSATIKPICAPTLRFPVRLARQARCPLPRIIDARSAARHSSRHSSDRTARPVYPNSCRTDLRSRRPPCRISRSTANSSRPRSCEMCCRASVRPCAVRDCCGGRARR